MAPEKIASIAEGPALKGVVFSRSEPSALLKMPDSTPTSAVACVRFGKYPNRNVVPLASCVPWAARAFESSPHADDVLSITTATSSTRRPAFGCNDMGTSCGEPGIPDYLNRHCGECRTGNAVSSRD